MGCGGGVNVMLQVLIAESSHNLDLNLTPDE